MLFTYPQQSTAIREKSPVVFPHPSTLWIDPDNVWANGGISTVVHIVDNNGRLSRIHTALFHGLLTCLMTR